MKTESEMRIEKGIMWLKEATKEGFSYVRWGASEKTRECPICNGHIRNGLYYGGNCIWLSSAYLYHGMGLTDVRCACDGLLGGSSSYTRILLEPYSLAQSFIDSKLGAGRFRLIRKSRRCKLAPEDLRAGDIIVYYRGGTFWHVAIYIGDERIIDCASESGGVSERGWELAYPCRAALRYTGD